MSIYNQSFAFLFRMTAFPHLRVVGKKINLPQIKTNNPKFDYCEIIAIDPPLIESLSTQSFTVLDNEISRATYRKTHEVLKNNDISKYLRITSGTLQRPQNKNTMERHAGNMSISAKKSLDSRNSVERNQTSFQYSDIPKVLNIKFLLKDPDESYHQIKSATLSTSKLPNYDTKSASLKPKTKVSSKNLVHLPSLTNNHQVIGRSISAITKKH